jgi:hypothetical protein
MIELNNKKIYFSGQGEKITKEELTKYLIQNGAELIGNENDAEIIIEGYMTPVYIQDKFYLLSKNGKEIYSIEQIEKEFSKTIDIDSILLALKISKDQSRIISLLKNSYFSDENFVKILKYYNWNNTGIYNSDENRDVATAITVRFCSLTESNHNIQHSPIGIYYTALETDNGKLLEIIYNMPKFSISDKNADKYQPLTLTEVVALNPNTPKPLLMQILKNKNQRELQFLAQNESIGKIIQQKLLEFQDTTISKKLIQANNIDFENIDDIFKEEDLKKEFLKYIKLSNGNFEKLLSLNLHEIEIIYLSSNPSLTTAQIEKLFKKNIDNANINLLKNSQCPTLALEKFLKLNDKIYNIAIASNEALEKNIFNMLEQLNDFDINLALAYNIKTPKELLKTLYEKNIHEINSALSLNTNTPINILMQLQIDNQYHTNVSNNETYKEFSRNSLGIISNKENQFKRNTYMDTVL